METPLPFHGQMRNCERVEIFLITKPRTILRRMAFGMIDLIKDVTVLEGMTNNAQNEQRSGSFSC